MRTYIGVTLPMLGLLFGVGGAVAADGAVSAESKTTSEYPSQPIELSAEQQKLVWQRVSAQPMNAPPPITSLPARPGQPVPNDVPLQPLPEQVTADVPALAGYSYAIVQDRLMIVNPASKTVSHVIDTNQRHIR